MFSLQKSSRVKPLRNLENNFKSPKKKNAAINHNNSFKKRKKLSKTYFTLSSNNLQLKELITEKS